MRKLFFVLVLAAGCHPKLTPAPPPLRPPVTVVTDPGTKPADAPTDCQPSGPSDELPSIKYGQRSTVEADNLARDGVGKLQSAMGPGIDEPTREGLVKDAVDSLIQALQADPYNVNATYNLAAAYARIDRKQCSINMLQRMIEMRQHPSQKAQVEEKLDRLLGRKKQSLDPDFKDLRGDERFRALISSICASTDDPDCQIGK